MPLHCQCHYHKPGLNCQLVPLAVPVLPVHCDSGMPGPGHRDSGWHCQWQVRVRVGPESVTDVRVRVVNGHCQWHWWPGHQPAGRLKWTLC